MCASPRRGQERTLEVEAERLRTVGRGGRHPAAHPLGEFDQDGDRRGHRGREEGRDAPPQESLGHPVEGLEIAHGVVPAPAVDVDVDEPGRDVRAVRGRCGTLDSHDRFVLDGDRAVFDAVVEDQPARDDLLGHGGVEEERVGVRPSRATSTQRPSRADRAMEALTSISSWPSANVAYRGCSAGRPAATSA